MTVETVPSLGFTASYAAALAGGSKHATVRRRSARVPAVGRIIRLTVQRKVVGYATVERWEDVTWELGQAVLCGHESSEAMIDAVSRFYGETDPAELVVVVLSGIIVAVT